MTELERAIADLPDDAMFPVRWIRKKLRSGSPVEHPEILSTRQAAERLGWNRKRWTDWCAAGLIAGAFRDEQDGHWRMPLSSCRARILAIQNGGHRKKRSAFRGGYAETEVPPARRNRPSLVQEG